MVEGSGVGGDLLKKSVTHVLVNALSNDASLFCNPMLVEEGKIKMMGPFK